MNFNSEGPPKPRIYQNIEELVKGMGGNLNQEVEKLTLGDWYKIKAAALQCALRRTEDPQNFIDVIKDGGQGLKPTDKDFAYGYHTWRFFTGSQLSETEKKTRKKIPLDLKVVLGLARFGMWNAGRILAKHDREHDGAIEGEFEVLKQKATRRKAIPPPKSTDES